MSITSFLYKALRLRNDLNAIRKGRVKQRIKRRVAGKVASKVLRKI